MKHLCQADVDGQEAEEERKQGALLQPHERPPTSYISLPFNLVTIFSSPGLLWLSVMPGERLEKQRSYFETLR
ncbi:hypothetical protein JRQ81_009975 [Phrynocephalus forsythii]|uniref:Uncharacterized protein n=1 Tax=Phrynocephalus forsythii TaxID=171643 RepID=A0A9Q1ARL8_9SAUR|nr:hypothetical protein JRQ81_009975 [Phrynocephalus forsythii]